MDVTTNRRPPWGTFTQVDDWNVGIIRGVTASDLVRRDRWRLHDVTWLLRHEPLTYVADPFPERSAAGGLCIWVERYSYLFARGGLARIDDAGSAPVPVAVRHPAPLGHVSYPSITTAPDGTRYGLLEMAEAGRLDLFRPAPDRSEWRYEAPLLDGPVVDPSLVFHEGRWWLFGTLRGPTDTSELHLFHADAILGPWRPHPLNPVKRDARSARPAGEPFRLGGTLFRPAQDCSGTYGGAVVITRIDELTPTAFAEEVVTRLESATSSAYPDGMHTLRLVGDRLVIDGKRRVPHPLATPVKAVARVRHALRARRMARSGGTRGPR